MLELLPYFIGYFGCPYNDLVICKNISDLLIHVIRLIPAFPSLYLKYTV